MLSLQEVFDRQIRSDLFQHLLRRHVRVSGIMVIMGRALMRFWDSLSFAVSTRWTIVAFVLCVRVSAVRYVFLIVNTARKMNVSVD